MVKSDYPYSSIAAVIHILIHEVMAVMLLQLEIKDMEVQSKFTLDEQVKNGRSVLEYELFAFHKMLPSALFLQDLLDELGYPQDAVMIFEDNKSLIDLLRRGKISSGVTRHIAAKYYYGKDLMTQGRVVIRHCPTLLMIADILTKNLAGKPFTSMSIRLRNCEDEFQDESLKDDVYRKLYQNSTENVYADPVDQKMNQLLSMILEIIMSQP